MSRRGTWLTAGAAACLAFGVRVGGALHYAFWQDEVTTFGGCRLVRGLIQASATCDEFTRRPRA
jgi:hypothetical protein